MIANSAQCSFNSPYEGVDLDSVNVVELLEGRLDLRLVRLDVDNEDESVVLLDLLHGALGVEGMDNDLVLIQPRRMRNRLARVLRGARDLQGFGAVEAGRVPDLGLFVGEVLGLSVSIALDARRKDQVRRGDSLPSGQPWRHPAPSCCPSAPWRHRLS